MPKKKHVISSFTYAFRDVGELASYLLEKANSRRKLLTSKRITSKAKIGILIEASAWEAAAHIVKNARFVKGDE